MRMALDTNRYVDFARGQQEVVHLVQSAERICMPLIVIGELRAGFMAGSRREANEQVLRRFLISPRVNVLLPDEDTTLHYAALYQQLRQQGSPVPTNDLWIAALVVQHALTLCSRDDHYRHLPQIAIV